MNLLHCGQSMSLSHVAHTKKQPEWLMSEGFLQARKPQRFLRIKSNGYNFAAAAQVFYFSGK